MAGLPKQIVSIPLAGLQSKADPKAAAIGTASRMENVVVTRRTEGGVEARKRNGFASLTRNILGGGALASGRTAGVLNDELVLCDGLKAYSYSAALAKWLARGRFQTISADLRAISSNEGPVKTNVSSAFIGSYSCYVSSPNSALSASTVARIYVQDVATKEILVDTEYPGGVYRARVVVVGTAFYVFCWDGGGEIQCIKIDTATPTIFGTRTTVASNAHGSGIFAVTVDAANGRMVVGYRDTTPKLTLAIWTTGMTAGAALAYAAGGDPQYCIGFLTAGFSGGSGLVAVGVNTAVGGTPNEIRLLTFDASTMAVSAPTTLEATARVPIQVSGYRSAGGVKNVFWTLFGATAAIGHYAGIRGHNGSGAYDAMLSVGLASPPFQIGAKWYLFAGYQSGLINTDSVAGQQCRTMLLELDENAVANGGAISVAGYLMANDSVGHPRSSSCLPAASVISSGRVVFACCGITSQEPAETTAPEQHYAVRQISLDWAGPDLGRPVAYSGVLHLPGAATKVYDGTHVIESGFYVNPEAITSATPGGSGTLNGVFQYCLLFARRDKAGRVVRSAPGPIFTVNAVNAGEIVLDAIPTLRLTDTDSIYNQNPGVPHTWIEVYRTQEDLPNFYRNAVLDNSATVDSISFTDSMTDEDLEKNEILYTTGGVLDHVYPPAVKVLHQHGDRLFAIVGDGSIWHTKVSTEGKGAEWSDDFRFTVEEGEGAPVALGTVDATLAIFKRNRTLLIQGTGPDEQGNNEFPRAQALGDDAGALGPGSVVESSLGVLVRSPKGWQVLGRDLALQPVEALAAYDALTPVFGAMVDGRPLVVIPTQADALVYDWQLSQFYTWTGDSSYLAGVCAARWRNTLVVLQADGTVKQQSSSSYADDGAPITKRVEGTWTDLKNGRVYEAAVTAEYMASTTVSVTISRDLDPATAQTKSIAVTTGTKGVVAMRPDSGRAAQVRYLIEESSATEGVRLSKIELEVGVRPGAQKRRQAQLMG